MAEFDDLDIYRRALKRALPWLRLVAAEPGRPPESDIHVVVRQVERALAAQAIETRRAETGTGSVHESAVGEADASAILTDICNQSAEALKPLGDSE